MLRDFRGVRLVCGQDDSGKVEVKSTAESRV